LQHGNPQVCDKHDRRRRRDKPDERHSRQLDIRIPAFHARDFPAEHLFAGAAKLVNLRAYLLVGIVHCVTASRLSTVPRDMPAACYSFRQ
jgi:hypothetical protein